MKGEGKVKFSFKNLTKKQKVLFITAIVVLSAAIALSIALPLTIGQSKIAEPYFIRFDQNSDSQVTLDWKPVRGASTYCVEYYFEGSDHVSTLVTGTRFYIDRKAGVLYARVLANVGDKSAFSEYVRQEIDPLTLSTPSVDLSDNGVAEWTNVYYKYRGQRLAVKNYTVELTIGDSPSVNLTRENLSVDLSTLISDVIGNTYYSEELGMDWTDVDVTVRVKALVSINSIYTPTAEEIFLKGAYVEGAFGSDTLTVTKEIYEEMKK